MDRTPHSNTRAAVATAALLFLCGLAWLSIRLVQPPRAVAADAPAAEFSSGRAMRHVREVAREPHPTGSEQIARVRRYILDELAALGVPAEVQAATVVPRPWAAGRPVSAARVENVVARVRGTAGGGKALMLAAHFDSVHTGPGASDDGAGVATILETMRALKAGPPLKNDLILLFTDAEELGLLGAQAFADEHPWMRDVGLVLNFEARGAGGPSMMFETSEGNGALVEGLAEAAPHTVANSLMYAVYKRLPNDTDMTVFKWAGAAGLNFAYTGRITSYHTALDSAEEMDERSLQHHGSYALALARLFGGRDLGGLRSRDAVYFNALGPLFVRYSEAWVVPLTSLAVLLLACVLLYGRRRGLLSMAGVGAGFAAHLVAAALSALLVTGAWRAARALHEGHAQLPWRTPYDVWPYALGFVFLTAAVFAAIYSTLFRRVRTQDLAAGALAWWLVLLLFVTAALPLGSFMYAWPLLFALAGLGFLLASGEGSAASAKGLVVVALCAAPGVALVSPLVYMFFMLLGLELGGAFMFMVALLMGLVVPHFRALTEGRGRWVLPAAAALAGVCFITAGLAYAGFDARRRKVNSVLYYLDADDARARWLSADAASDEWTSQFVPAGAEPGDAFAEIFPWVRQKARAGDAPALGLAAPELQIVEDRTEGDARTLRVRLTSPRRASLLLFYTRPEWGVRRAVLEGRTLLDGEAAVGAAVGGGNPLRVSFAAPPPEGVELVLEARAGAPLSLVVGDISYGLPELPGRALRPRPADAMPAPSGRSTDITVVRKTFDFTQGRGE